MMGFKTHGGKLVKRIEIKTFGVRWGLYPGTPPRDVLQHVVDVRGMMADPGSTLPAHLSGLDHEVRSWILLQSVVPDWLGRERQLMQFRLGELEARDEATTLRVYYCCHGGCQRSVVIAEDMAAWLKVRYGERYQVEVKHLTLLLTQADKVATAAAKAPPSE